jgi:hypothetical protein
MRDVKRRIPVPAAMLTALCKPVARHGLFASRKILTATISRGLSNLGNLMMSDCE